MIKLLAVIALLLYVDPAFSQGSYAGKFKLSIGQVYRDRQLPAAFKGFQFREGSLLSTIDDPEQFDITLMQKGSTWIVYISLTDSARKNHRLIDLIELTNVSSKLQIKTILCRTWKSENPMIVALVQKEMKAYLSKVKKAWVFNRDKRRFVVIPVKGIDCMNEGFGE